MHLKTWSTNRNKSLHHSGVWLETTTSEKNLFWPLRAEFPPVMKYYTNAWCFVKGVMQLQNTTAITVRSVVHHPTLSRLCAVQKLFLLPASSTTRCGAGVRGGTSEIIVTIALTYWSFSYSKANAPKNSWARRTKDWWVKGFVLAFYFLKEGKFFSVKIASILHLSTPKVEEKINGCNDHVVSSGCIFL